MLVKKLKDEWQPTENPGLKIGETTEVTNPRALIEQGLAIGVDSQGNEVGAFELYGVIMPDEREEFAKWQAIKKQAQINAKLEQEKAELEKALKDDEKLQTTVAAEAKTEVEAPATVEASVEPVAEKTPEELLKEKRVANMAKARAAREANKK